MSEEEFKALVSKKWEYNRRFYDIFINEAFRSWVLARLNYVNSGLSLWARVKNDRLVVSAELTCGGRYITKDEFIEHDYFVYGEIKKHKDYAALADACIEYLKMTNPELYEEVLPHFVK